MSKIFRPVFESKHFAKGSSCPEVKPGVIRLYSMKFCPYAQRVRLVLAAKKIPNEVININLQSKPEWYLERNPLGKVPCLEFDGKLVFESLITADYLDEAYPKPCLLNSEDPFQKSQDRIMIELFNKITTSAYKVLYCLDSSDIENSSKEPYQNLISGLEIFEKEITKRDTQYLGGDLPGMLDYMIWPWMERIPAIPIVTKGILSDPCEKFPKTMDWCSIMEKDDAVQATYSAPIIHAKFIQMYLSGNVDYDMDTSI